ncbi:NADPH oxidoreductase (Stearoyl-CoA 9-desaturase electron transfer partner) [Durusdinium trenchii]|uniref:NADPH oxidoreductase (Stearoyl-CoA 9-desaturase electron transfer partner) n=1 Tax=Durusdinium trenchii TaxID=1381693 RepID=A0ABP0M383_9DINO
MAEVAQQEDWHLREDRGPGVWHAGERQVQERVMGTRLAKNYREKVGAFIRRRMPQQHVEFFQEANWLVVSTLDEDGHPRASLVQQTERGQDLFRGADDGSAFALRESGFLHGDQTRANALRPGGKLGILGIQLTTRRRNRVNGTVQRLADGHVHVEVDASFGNCPKYIQGREMTLLDQLPRKGSVVTHTTGFGAFRQWFERADTFFIASGNSANGVDASHRGGPVGFLKMDEGASKLRFPDYSGNGFFNTLGNITLDPRVSLLLIDFASGDILQVAGRATISFVKDKDLPGSERTVEVAIERLDHLTGVLAWKFSDEVDRSPFNPPATADEGDLLEVIGVEQETHDVRTIYLRAPRPVIYHPGQYASFFVTAGGETFTRAWTLSSTAHEGPGGDEEFAITVKNKSGGAVSPLLHNDAKLSALEIRLAGVEGEFTLPPEGPDPGKAVVFAAAGSGFTPVMSVLRRLVAGQSVAHPPVVVFLSVQTADDIIFVEELQILARLASDRLMIVVSLTRETQISARARSAHPGMHLSPGRVSKELVAQALSNLPPDAVQALYVCGPTAFADGFQAIFRQVHVPDRVVTESFDY